MSIHSKEENKLSGLLCSRCVVSVLDVLWYCDTHFWDNEQPKWLECTCVLSIMHENLGVLVAKKERKRINKGNSQDTLRKSTWPKDLSLMEMLYGNLPTFKMLNYFNMDLHHHHHLSLDREGCLGTTVVSQPVSYIIQLLLIQFRLLVSLFSDLFIHVLIYGVINFIFCLGTGRIPCTSHPCTVKPEVLPTGSMKWPT